jgi:hypothetical protein
MNCKVSPLPLNQAPFTGDEQPRLLSVVNPDSPLTCPLRPHARRITKVGSVGAGFGP